MADGQASTVREGRAAVPGRADVVIVGAGFAGMYLLHLMRQRGIDAVALEKGAGVGGTWYWNRYPGARCDIESVQYSHRYLPELEQEWDWSERYAAQPEILAYADHIADRLDLRRDICFGRRVVAAHWSDADREWRLATDTGERIAAPYLIMATGCLSVPNAVDFPGRETFRGPTYQTGEWPHEPVDFTGMRVGVIGTGSSAIQSIPIIAAQADALWVFQRTPNYSVPAHNRPLDPAYRQKVKADYPALRARQRLGFAAADFHANPAPGVEASEADRRRAFEARWEEGGLGFMAAFADMLLAPETNASAAEFVREKIRAIVHDPETAEKLCPTNTIGCKRLCVDTGFYEVFNQPHVHLVDISAAPIERITETAILTGGRAYELDAIVYATGFDAMTGALLRVDIQGRQGRRLKEHWKDGPRSYLGIGIAGFPNLFTVTGPGSPSVFTNMIPSIEQHCEWITDCIAAMRAAGRAEIEPTPEAEAEWVAHNLDVAGAHLRSSCSSWYTGENIAGKPKVFMPYIGGFPRYVDRCDEIAAQGYEGFRSA
jgi:cation diffusion facilitator CzcD-associated flavoprotein CzcO